MMGRLTDLQTTHFCPQELLAISCIVIGGSFFSYLLLIVGQRQLQPPTVAACNYVQPIIAAIVGILLGLDILTWQKCLPLLLIATGVLLISKRVYSTRSDY